MTQYYQLSSTRSNTDSVKLVVHIQSNKMKLRKHFFKNSISHYNIFVRQIQNTVQMKQICVTAGLPGLTVITMTKPTTARERVEYVVKSRFFVILFCNHLLKLLCSFHFSFTYIYPCH